MVNVRVNPTDIAVVFGEFHAGTSIILDAGDDWLDTGIDIVNGQQYTITAAGTWAPVDPAFGTPGQFQDVGPDGYSTAIQDDSGDNFLNFTDIGSGITDGLLLTQTPSWGALIGYIDDGPSGPPPAMGSYAFGGPTEDAKGHRIFIIGSSFTETAGGPNAQFVAGRLYIRSNDDAYGAVTADNSGSILILIDKPFDVCHVLIWDSAGVYKGDVIQTFHDRILVQSNGVPGACFDAQGNLWTTLRFGEDAIVGNRKYVGLLKVVSVNGTLQESSAPVVFDLQSDSSIQLNSARGVTTNKTGTIIYTAVYQTNILPAPFVRRLRVENFDPSTLPVPTSLLTRNKDTTNPRGSIAYSSDIYTYTDLANPLTNDFKAFIFDPDTNLPLVASIPTTVFSASAGIRDRTQIYVVNDWEAPGPPMLAVIDSAGAVTYLGILVADQYPFDVDQANNGDIIISGTIIIAGDMYPKIWRIRQGVVTTLVAQGPFITDAFVNGVAVKSGALFRSPVSTVVGAT